MSNRSHRRPHLTIDPRDSPRGRIGEEATRNVAALFAAKLVELTSGDRVPLHASIDDMTDDPRKMMGVTLVMLNISVGLAQQYYPGGLQALTDYFIDQVLE